MCHSDRGRAQVIEQGWGAFGNAGRVGNWDDLLLVVDASSPLVLRVEPSRGPARFLLFTADEVREFLSVEGLEISLDVLEIDYKIPKVNDDLVTLNKEEK
jgi:hypothetical protein